MLIFNKKLNQKGNKEKGIALIFSLIMLSLLLLLVLSFAMDSMFEQKAAYNSANASAAGSLAQVQLKQILSLVENNATNFTTGNVYSIDFTEGFFTPLDPSCYASPTVLEKKKFKFIDMLKERFPVYGVLDDNNDNSCLEPKVKVNWNYIRNNGPDSRIIGRAAYIIIPDEKIPLPSLVDNRTGAPATYPQHNEINNTETRIGKYVSEINVRATIPDTVTLAGSPTTTKINNITDTLNWNSIGNGLYNGNWTSYTNLFDTINGVITPDLVLADKEEFQAKLSLSATDDAEAFWADKNANYKLDDGELYRRFNLARDDWDTADNAADLVFIRTQILLDSAGTGMPMQAMQTWDKTDDTAVTTGLPWLACFGFQYNGAPGASSLSKTYPNISTRRNQIAANLKDYCDSDSRPTSDKDPANWLTQEPSFTGNEQTPYINKIGIQIKVEQVKSFAGNHWFWGNTYNISSTIEIRPYFELINIYKPNFIFSANCKIKVEGEIKVQSTLVGSGDTDTDTYDFDKTFDIPAGVFSNGYSSFMGGELALIDGGPDFSISTQEFDNLYGFHGDTIKVDIIEVIIKKVVFYEADGYDYVKELEEGSHLSEIFNGNGTTSPGFGWYGWAVHDPRQNLNDEDWVVAEPSSGSDDATTVLSLTGSAGGPYTGNPNAAGPTPTESPSAGNGMTSDKENSSDPASFSTAYIRNAAMESPWELGFIHRGARWQTINLKMYDPTKAVTVMPTPPFPSPYIAGGESYLLGDANILDQVKMVPDALSPQKINLKNSVTDGFNALLSKVKYGCEINSKMTVLSMAGFPDPVEMTLVSGTELHSTDDIPVISEAIKDKYESTVNPERRLTRASVVDKLLLPMPSPAISVDTDAKQEELIGKIVNLTKVGRQTGHFIVIVLAQTIKDVGGPLGTPIKIHKYADDETTNDTQDCEIGVFNAGIDLNNPEQSIYYDEITSEQKIMLKGRVLGGGKIKILSFQYVD